MNEIEFIPLINLFISKDTATEGVPPGTSSTNLIQWDIYQKRVVKKNYLNILEPISAGIYQYRLFDFGIEDIERAINLYIGETDINESDSLWGGYAVAIDGKIELYPQCCGLLEEIQDWKKILDENFVDFHLKECHPSPLITKKDNEIFILCKDDYETFFPLTTKEKIILNYQDVKLALIKLINKLTNFSTKLNTLSHK